MTGVRLYLRPGCVDGLAMLPHEQLAILPPHLVHRLRSDDRTEGAMEIVVDPHPSERQLVMSELRAILEVQFVMAVPGECFVHAAQLPVDLPPRAPEFACQWLLDVEIGRCVGRQEAR